MNKKYIENIDAWVKKINGEMQNFETIAKVLKEIMDNTEHNYELAQEMRQEIEELKQEIKILKIIQFTMIKSKVEHGNSIRNRQIRGT